MARLHLTINSMTSEIGYIDYNYKILFCHHSQVWTDTLVTMQPTSGCRRVRTDPKGRPFKVKRCKNVNWQLKHGEIPNLVHCCQHIRIWASSTGSSHLLVLLSISVYLIVPKIMATGCVSNWMPHVSLALLTQALGPRIDDIIGLIVTLLAI